MRKTNFLFTLLRMNLRELGALRLGSTLQVIFMLLNNLVFFVFWIIIYSKVDSISGAKLPEVAMIYSISAASFGVMSVLFGGSLRLSELILDGKLDVYLTQPRDPHIQLLASRTLLSGWGDLLTAPILLVMYWGADPWAWLGCTIAAFVGAITFVSSLTIFHSIIFWIPRGELLSQQLSEFLLTFSLYPNSIFAGPVRALTYTLIPAAFISYLPMLMVRDHAPIYLLGCAAAALLYWAICRAIFRLGLRRYESGNQYSQVR